MSSIKISEIKKYADTKGFESIINGGKIYGVEVDEPTFSIPDWVKEIGLLMKVSDGAIEDDVLDAAISFSLRNVHVILEVDFYSEIDDEYLVNVAANAGFSLSYLPPSNLKSQTEKKRIANLNAYIEKIKNIVKLYLTRQFFKEVLPISSYMNYLFFEVYNGKEAAKEFKVDDEYIKSRFVSAMTVEDSDKMKEEMRSVIMNHFGGEDSFKGISLHIRRNIQKRFELNLISLEKDAKERSAKESLEKDDSE